MAVRVLLVRHGRTAWSLAGRHTGRTDVPLLPEGRQQAARLGERLNRAPWDGLPDTHVCTSPLARAAETCALAGFHARAEHWDLLREFDYGAMEGLTTPQIQAERGAGWQLWRDGVDGGETLDELTERADRVAEWAADVDGDVALFAHGHLLRAVAARWLDRPVGFAAALPLDPGSLSVLGWAHDVPALSRWNDSAHLD